ncbi:16S rRNA (cytosine(1402)-N(4))-methyltransferase [Paucibacter sp. O1-1]|nr:16S rRNA (cytosine(1402)-N(4))-methyltransferase [Paucibacter sp. O1-1]MDA3831372.1 16S rRNA (cytosine(1402)-N(4))-methyltransferase [Paucibacter sp. O1-1]
MKQDTLKHVPVMLAEAVDALAAKQDGTYLDGTFGRGGHAREVLRRLGPEGRLLLMDRDPLCDRVAARAEFGNDPRVAVCHGSFAALGGWSRRRRKAWTVYCSTSACPRRSWMIRQRGFGFQADAPLDMRMDTTQGESAAEFLARADETRIADVLFPVRRRTHEPPHSPARSSNAARPETGAHHRGAG